MSTAPTSTERATRVPTAAMVDTNLEVIVIPVSDVERAKRSYASLGSTSSRASALRRPTRPSKMRPDTWQVPPRRILPDRLRREPVA
jgi:hypothetical protein